MNALRPVILIVICGLCLQGCVTTLITAPVKAVYTVGKYTVKGTAAVVSAVIPDGDDEKEKSPSEDE